MTESIYEGLMEIEKLEPDHYAVFVNDHRKIEAKINEIIEKVNILIALKTRDIDR
jgi:hypothetical protein